MRMLAMVLIASLASATLGAAQERSRDTGGGDLGPYVRAGVGLLNVSGDCSPCAEWGGGGVSLTSALGWRFSRRFSVAIGVDGGDRIQDQTRERAAHLSVGTRVDVWKGLALVSGVGPLRVRQDVAVFGGEVPLKGSGTGWLAGGEYALPMGDRLILTPAVVFRGSTPMDLERDGTAVIPRYSYRSVELSVSVVWTLRSLIWLRGTDLAPE